MRYRVFLWIGLLQICRVHSTDDYDVKSPGAILGIILAAIIIIAATIIVFVICMKKRWNKGKERPRRKPKTHTEKKKKEIVSQKPPTITETLVDRLPDIPEEDENIGDSRASIQDESKLTLPQNGPKLYESKEGTVELVEVHKQTGNTSISSIELDEGHVNSEEITFENEKAKTRSSSEEKMYSREDIVKERTTYDNKQEEKLSSSGDIVKQMPFSDIKQEGKRASSEDIVKSINREEESIQEITDEVSITRVLKNENTLRKDLPFLNSTENIFSEYDPAMTYKAEAGWKLSKSEEGLNSTNIKSISKEIPPKTFEFTRDDSDLNLKSQSKLEAEGQVGIRANSCSEGTLTEDKKNKSLKRRSSLISKITSKSFEWNFDYISPYAMTEKQKRERFEFSQRMKKRRIQIRRQNHAEKDKKQYENNLAFEKWKRQKHDEKTRGDIGSFNSKTSNRYRFWYP